MDIPFFSSRARPFAIQGHPASEVVHGSLNRDLRGGAHAPDGADRFAHHLLPATEHMLHPRTNTGKLLVALVDVGLVKAVGVVLSDHGVNQSPRLEQGTGRRAVIASVSVHGLAGLFARLALIDQVFQRHAIIDVGGGDLQGTDELVFLIGIGLAPK